MTEPAGSGSSEAQASNHVARADRTGGPAHAGALVHDEAVMGTVCSFLVLPGAVPTEQVRAAIADACATLHQADATFSTWVDDSPLSRHRRGELPLEDCPDDVAEVLRLAAVARRATAGWFDPWALPGGVDPTGLVKGWAVERAAGVLADAGVPGGLVNAGGDIATVGCAEGGDAWRIGIRHPWRPDALACVLAVTGAVATSGTYERGAHLIDPHTRTPWCAAASATVTGPSLALADAFATALAVGGDEAFDLIEAVGGYACYLVRPDGTERVGAGIDVRS
ncbi:MAG: FAD:protein FMN transferase [Acidimicrobiales bacterium]